MDDEWLKEINKKIADLTKRVFQLHAQSTERRNEIQNLQMKYQQELDSAKQSTEEAFRKMNSNIDKYK